MKRSSMGSRLRENPIHLFECFCEVTAPTEDNLKPWILQKFPESFNDQAVLRPTPEFTFPCDFEKTTVQHFSFVLTSGDSKWTFGFCRHAPKSDTAIILLSHLPWHEVFYKLLNQIADVMQKSDSGALWRFLQDVYKASVPEPGTDLTINVASNTYSWKCPDHFKLPSIPENRNLTEYFNAVDAQNMMEIFASMLYERRIVITSRRLSRLSACVQAANELIMPMTWQHIFIPVLPNHLIDYLSAPMPFLIGVPTSIMQKVKIAELGEAVILDADNNKVTTPFRDLESLPLDVVLPLKRNLKNPDGMLGDRVSRSFLKALVQLIGGYREALILKEGELITFSPEAFVRTRPSMQPFLEQMLQLQIFQQFIEERLEVLNSGLGYSDEFEKEVCLYSGKPASAFLQIQPKEWFDQVRKEGGAFIKTVKTKANPAMKSAAKSVKVVRERSKSAYRDIRTKLREGGDTHSVKIHSIMNKSLGTPSPPPRMVIEEEDEGETTHSAPTSPTQQVPRFAKPFSPSRALSTFRKTSQQLNPLQNSRSSLSSPASTPALGLDENAVESDGDIDFPTIDMSDLREVLARKFNIHEDLQTSQSAKTERTNQEAPVEEVVQEIGDLVQWDSPEKDAPPPVPSREDSLSSFDPLLSPKLNDSSPSSTNMGAASPRPRNLPESYVWCTPPTAFLQHSHHAAVGTNPKFVNLKSSGGDAASNLCNHSIAQRSKSPSLIDQASASSIEMPLTALSRQTTASPLLEPERLSHPNSGSNSPRKPDPFHDLDPLREYRQVFQKVVHCEPELPKSESSSLDEMRRNFINESMLQSPVHPEVTERNGVESHHVNDPWTPNNENRIPPRKNWIAFDE